MLSLVAAVLLTQNYTVQPPVTQAYQPLTGYTVQTMSESDDGFVNVPLGFTFPYYGNNYTVVHIDTNGFIAFGNTAVCETGFGCYNGDGIPMATRSTAIHNLIAPWWDDLNVASPGQVRTKATSGQMEIEFAQVSSLSGSFTVTFQVKITAAGTIEIRYGAITGSSSSATVGFENSTGTLGAALLNCSTTTSNCAHANWPTNTLYIIGQPVQSDIAVPAVNISNLVNSGNISLTVTPTFQNFGQTAVTTPFAWKAYLSTNQTWDASDILIYASPANVTLGSAGTGTAIATPSGSATTVTAPPVANYYVVVVADDGPAVGAVVEALETNNVGSTTNFFINGLDLVATAVSGPATSGPGNVISVNVKWLNQGSNAPAAPVAYRILGSLDQVASGTDAVLYSGTRAVTGGETVDENVSVTVPGTVIGGDLYYILQLDPLGAVAETNELNNAVASTAKVTMKQADLVNVAADFLDPITSGPTRLGYFGQPAKAQVRVDNIGGANASNFKIGVIVSNDATLSLLSDTIAVEQVVPVVAFGGTQTVDIPFTMPLKDRNGNDFVTGTYYLFTVADSTSAVTELNESNNNLVIMGTVSLRAPASDLTVTRLEAPASGAVGEIFPVLRTLKNIGNVNAPSVKYRYYASANAIITPEDVPLLIKSGATENVEGAVTLGVSADDTQTELIRLPATMPAGTYYLGCIIDTGFAVTELEEGNNALASATVQVAATSLRVSTQQLPDAMVDRPFIYQLVALGEMGAASTWAIDLSQGALPMGMSLSTGGLLTGTPTVPGVSAFTVVITNNGREARARLVLRVLPTSTEVEITTKSLPPVTNVNTQKYEHQLGAAGGVKPYAWRIVGGSLPQNLTLTPDGTISGFPKLGLTEGASNVTFEVVDTLGTRASKSLSLRVIAPGAILFKSLNLRDGIVGEDYGTDIVVANDTGVPIAAMQKPLNWTIQGTLPDGITMLPAGDVLSIDGKPLRAGSFSFTLTVEDAKGHTDSAELTIRIHASRFQLQAVGLPEVSKPGDVVGFEITATSMANPKFQLYSGNLAPGLTMAADGKVTGTLPDTSEGVYNFVVTARDDNGSTGLGAFSMEVKRPAKVVGCTCGSSDASSGMLWLFALLAPLVAMRRRAVR